MPFKSKAQARYFYAMAKDDPKFKDMAEEFSRETDWENLPDKKKKKKKKKKISKKAAPRYYGMPLDFAVYND